MLSFTSRRVLAATCVLVPLHCGVVLPATAQVNPPLPPAVPGATAPGPEGIDSSADHAENNATAEETPTPTRTAAPDTQSCPHALRPGDPITTSEALAPGQQAPTPPPVTYQGSCGVIAAPGYRVPQDQTAGAWLVFDLDSGEVIAQKDPHGRYRPASVIKVLLALVALRDLDYHAVIPVSERAAGMEGSAVGIGTTGRYTTEDLLHGLLLASGNDAAQALAEALGGDAVALRKVNDLAAQIGTTDTHVGSVTGLDTAGQMTSVTDLAKMYRYAWQNPAFAAIVNTEFWNLPGYDDHPGYEVWNDNGLFLNDPDGIGGKTGYTDDANHTFVGAMDRGGRRLAAVVLDTTIDKGRPWEQAQRLLHAAYALPRGASVGDLDQQSGAVESSAAPSPAPQPGDTSESAGSSTAQRGALIGTVVAGIVLVAAALLTLLSLRRRR
ncbi:D-alanyl-D-alanine carboxypeptidase family protein [Corynebacterium oculi]|uniref:D-alanyl-D-alanine carboxypeptidase DacD n=1 Tax=Corynebacterium oculi TaxID=1544416 RepID=A0A0Q1AC37_9CORY|nr:serine hydrolase [Corynebacterium oculi]KQB84180.1 D-alanyl-D-alanine carboxypeptidase DacD precursor [Corynebacterium oculi]